MMYMPIDGKDSEDELLKIVFQCRSLRNRNDMLWYHYLKSRLVIPPGKLFAAQGFVLIFFLSKRIYIECFLHHHIDSSLHPIH